MIILGGMIALMVMPVRAQKWEKLADTPQMGWSTWNKFQGNISEEIIKGIADAMVESGLRDVGYTYINIDDCWHGQRDGFSKYFKEEYGCLPSEFVRKND